MLDNFENIQILCRLFREEIFTANMLNKKTMRLSDDCGTYCNVKSPQQGWLQTQYDDTSTVRGVRQYD